MKKVLLIEPAFPIPVKSKNHKNLLPIGLLKMAAYLRENRTEVKLLRGLPQDIVETTDVINFCPDEIWVTSLFTYWARYVKDAVQYYKGMFPKAKVIVGGIYASLLPKNEVINYTGCDEVWQGVVTEAEKYFPAYDLVQDTNPDSIDYQIVHASRGCERRCPFCGTWKIEPEFVPELSIRSKIKYRKVIFYDSNFLMNPHIEDILRELIDLKSANKIAWCECQSGFDGRILLERPRLARMLRLAGFRYPRIAWDWKYDEHPEIERQIGLLVGAGYPKKDIYVFMLYNWEVPFEEMEMKRVECWHWGVQIADCRYRPLNQLHDNYDARQSMQTSKDYYIHSETGWNDTLVKQFRKNVRRQNICVRHGFPFYSAPFEHKRFGREIMKRVKELESIEMKIQFLERMEIDYWFPERVEESARHCDYSGR